MSENVQPKCPIKYTRMVCEEYTYRVITMAITIKCCDLYSCVLPLEAYWDNNACIYTGVGSCPTKT